MTDYILLMHNDAPASEGMDAWKTYIAGLQAAGRLLGGSAIGSGICVRKTDSAPSITRHLAGFMRVTADSLADARALVSGNPVFEAGGTVEIRELPRTE
jgi:hypothetical protein